MSPPQKKAAAKQGPVPADIARQANRSVFYRTISVLAICALGILGILGYSDVAKKEDPCSLDLHGFTCQARTCERLQDVHYKLTPYCAILLRKIREKHIDIGAGSTDKHGADNPNDIVGSIIKEGSGGGSSGGSGADGGSSPGPKPAVNINVPDVPGINLFTTPCIDIQGVVGFDC